MNTYATVQITSRSKLLLLAVSAIASLAFVFFASPQASAAVEENSQNVPNNVIYPTGNPGNDMACVDPDGATQGHAQNAWITPSGDSLSTNTFTIEQGTSSVSLKANFLVRHCNSSLVGGNVPSSPVTKILYTRNNIVSSTTTYGSISGLGGGPTLSYADSYANNYRYVKESKLGIPVHDDFTLSGLGSLPAGQHYITVNMTTRVINEFEVNGTPNIYRCVADGSVASGLSDSSCPTSTQAFVISVFVSNTPVVNLPIGNCDELRGYAYDEDVPNTKVTVVLVRDSDVIASTIANLPSSIPGSPQDGHVFSFDISSWRDIYDHTYTVRVRDLNHLGQPQPGEENVVTDSLTLGSTCATIECDAIQFTPSQIEPNEPFSARTSFTLAGQGINGDALRYDIVLNISEDEAGTIGVTGGTSSRALAPPTFYRDFPDLILPSYGQYYSRFRVRIWNYGATTPTSRSQLCTDDDGIDNPEAAFLPYVKFYGNDVFAGAVFDDNNDGVCATPSESSILTNNTVKDFGGENYTVGSSVEYAAFAIDTMGGAGVSDPFATAGRRHGTQFLLATSVPAGLAFGNFEGGAKMSIGDFAGGARCVPDYFANRPSSAQNVTSSSFDMNGKDGAYYRDGDLIINGGTVAAGNNVTLYVSGDLHIEVGTTLAPYTGIDDIPSLWIIAEGDITIRGGIGSPVTQTDGVLVTKGTLRTCTTPLGNRYADTVMYSQCNSKLTIRGAAIAGNVELLRTNGTLADADPNEPQSSTTIGEVFEFLPEIYLSEPAGLRKAGTDTNYDYITSLPPIL